MIAESRQSWMPIGRHLWIWTLKAATISVNVFGAIAMNGSTINVAHSKKFVATNGGYVYVRQTCYKCYVKNMRGDAELGD
jgi:hypothetical protein